MKSSTIFLLIFMITIAFNQQIVDYSLTESIEKSLRDSNAKYNINIIAQNIDDKFLNFPEACKIDQDLQIHEVIEYTSKNLINNGELINNFKANMTIFLKLAQKLKNSRLQIKNLQQNLPKHAQKTPQQILANQQIQYLKQLEQSLQNLNKTIKDKVFILQQLIISQINRTTNNNILNQVRLNFEYVAYEARLKFLQDIKKNNINNFEYTTQRQNRIQQYFKDITFQNGNEIKHLKQLNNLLQNYAIVSQIKLRISNELKKLQAKNYTIQNKLDCQKKMSKPIHKQNQNEIQLIINNLKQLKSIQSPNRQHCQGVAKKLQNQLKKVLKMYNYSYLCKEGLQQLYKQKQEIQQKIKKLKQKLNNLDYQNNYKKIQLFYKNLQSDKNILIDKIVQFDINQYLINKDLLNDQIYNIKNRLINIQLHIKNPKESDVRPFDYQKIKDMVKTINQEQLKYCKLKKIYDDEYLKIEDVVDKYQYRSSNRLELYREFIYKVNQLQQLQKEFNEIRQSLLLSIA